MQTTGAKFWLRRRGVGGVLLAALGSLAGARAGEAQPAPRHRLLMHVNRGDADTMNEALDNLRNALDDVAGRNETIAAELVANGAGYAMLRDNSPVAARVADMHRRYPGVVFSACQNSRRGIAKREGKRPEQIVELPEASDVPAGIVRVMELQEQGWSYYKV